MHRVEGPPGDEQGLLRALTGWTIGPFGLKDVFTLVNLVSGVVAIHYALAGQARDAGYAVIAGFVFGDLVDGAVARATRTGNRFGSQFDTITDHFVHVMVPGLVLYTVYDRAGHATLGLVALGLLMAGASIRHALFAVAPFDFALCWCGLPRTIVGFCALALPLSHLFPHLPAPYLVGTAMVAALSVLSVVPVPYMTHRGERGLQWFVKAGVVAFVATFPLVFLFARSYFFDSVFIWFFGFAVAGWSTVHPDERRQFRVEYRRWSASVKT